MYFYKAFGLDIRSDLPLPEFVSTNDGSDVFIRLVGSDYIPLDARGEQPYMRLNHDESVVSIGGVGTFVVRYGREILVVPELDIDERLLRRYIVGNIMAILLYQREMLVLHASTVANGNGAVSFVGAPGYGKSTIASALSNAGFGFIADDVTAVQVGDGALFAKPGYPQVKLSLEAVKALGNNKTNLIQLDVAEDKNIYQLVREFVDISRPMHCIYILTKEDGMKIEPITPQSAVLELIRHSIPTRWVRLDDVDHFKKCIVLASKVPFFYLSRSKSLLDLPEMVNMVKEHLKGISQAHSSAKIHR